MCMGRSMFQTSNDFNNEFQENLQKQKDLNENYEEETGDKAMSAMMNSNFKGAQK